MRLISGQYKGRTFESKLPGGVRPTQGNVKESIFNTLENIIDFEKINVADFCAGTGSLGFEALSRGALSCLFIEKNFKVSEIIRHNAKKIGIGDEYFKIIVSDCLKCSNRIIKTHGKIKFGLIFSDPPYLLNMSNKIINIIFVNDFLEKKGIFVAEHGLFEKITVPEGWNLVKERAFGDKMVSFLTKII